MSIKGGIVLNYLYEYEAEKIRDARIASLFDKDKVSEIKLIEDSKENRDIIRDFVYYRVSEFKPIVMFYDDLKKKNSKMKNDTFSSEIELEASIKYRLYEEEKKRLQITLDKMLEAADKNGVTWIREFIDSEKSSPFYQMNIKLSNNRKEGGFLEGISFDHDLKAIKMYNEYPIDLHSDYEVYTACREERDIMRNELFGMIADDKVKYPINELLDFCFSSDDDKKLYFNTDANIRSRKDKNGKVEREEDEWWDKTNIIGNEDKYPKYLRGIKAITERIVREVDEENATYKEPVELVLNFYKDNDKYDVGACFDLLATVSEKYPDLRKECLDILLNMSERTISKYKEPRIFAIMASDLLLYCKRFPEATEPIFTFAKKHLNSSSEIVRKKMGFLCNSLPFYKPELTEEALPQETDVKLKEVQQKLQESQQALSETRQALSESEQKTAKEKEMFLEGTGISKLSPVERRELFDKSNRLRREHPVMQEVALTIMCRCYTEEKDKKTKLELLKELYQIRKGGETRQEKNDMADTFARVLDKTPELKADDNLVRLSQRDTVVKQPTKAVRRQVESAGK